MHLQVKVIFWETINAAGVLQVPLAFLANGYGISVPKKEYQNHKSDQYPISRIQKTEWLKTDFDIYKLKGARLWRYVRSIRTLHERTEKHIHRLFFLHRRKLRNRRAIQHLAAMNVTKKYRPFIVAVDCIKKQMRS
jgi:hypothetical protein